MIIADRPSLPSALAGEKARKHEGPVIWADRPGKHALFVTLSALLGAAAVVVFFFNTGFAWRVHRTLCYFVTNQRAIVAMDNFSKIISYPSYDIFFAQVKRGRRSTDILFRKTENPEGNFWSIRYPDSVVAALGRLISE